MDESTRKDSSSSPSIGAELLQALRESLAEPEEAKRDTLLLEVLRGFNAGASNDQLSDLSRKVRTLDEDNAILQDRCSGLQADLENCFSQLEAAKQVALESDQSRSEGGDRLKSLQAEAKDLASHLEAGNKELHAAQLENDQILLKLQRAELAQQDTSKFDRAAEGRRALTAEVEGLRAEMATLRESKDDQIAQLNQTIAEGGSQPQGSGGVDFDELWRELVTAEPPLVGSADVPTQHAGQRAMQVLIELLRFADDVDQLARPLVGKYTKGNQPIQVPWDVYARGENMRGMARSVLQPTSGKPAGVVQVRLRALYTWMEAALIAADATIESVAPELHTYVMQQGGAADDPNRKIKDFLRDDGHELFQQHMRHLCSRKLAEAFGHSQ